MELLKIAKRGANKVLSEDSWVSASFREGGLRSVCIWFRESGTGASRHSVQMTRKEVEELDPLAQRGRR